MRTQVVEWLARYKPKQLARSGLVRHVVAALCALCAEPEPPEHDNDDQLSAAKFAAQVLPDLADMHLLQHTCMPRGCPARGHSCCLRRIKCWSRLSCWKRLYCCHHRQPLLAAQVATDLGDLALLSRSCIAVQKLHYCP